MLRLDKRKLPQIQSLHVSILVIKRIPCYTVSMVGFRQRLRKILNARYSVSAWLWILVSTATAIVMFILIASGEGATPGLREFLSVLPVNGYFWSGGLIITGITKIYGMATGKERAVVYGSFFAFCLWVFGAIAFLLSGNAVSVILLILPFMIFNAFLFLGALLREESQL